MNSSSAGEIESSLMTGVASTLGGRSIEDGGVDGGTTVVEGWVEAKRIVTKNCAGFVTTSEGRHDEQCRSVSRPCAKSLRGALVTVEANYESTLAKTLRGKGGMLLCGR